MNVIKLGKKGQVSIPRAVLQRLGVQDEQLLLVDTTDDGAILLRPAGAYPIAMYSDERIAEFLAEDTMSGETEQRVSRRLGRHRVD
jgi:bifunctional DNA-binding transcriptional regulator/antitoxin component of YhaV-PrlF toxin-antitoxin module